MTKGLKEGQLLHDSTKFQFTSKKKIKNEGKLAGELAYIARPKPATGLQKLQVGIYNSVNKKGKEKGFGRWVRRKIGKPPVLYDETTIERSRQVMEKHLQDNGYFGSTIIADTIEKEKKVSVKYDVSLSGQYHINKIIRPVDTLPITHLMKANESATFLKPDRPYSLANLTSERSRLADLANNHGFYEVTKDNFYYFVDTTAGPLQADIYLRLKQTGDSSMYQLYYLDKSWVYPDHSLEQRNSRSLAKDTFEYNMLHIVQKEMVLRPTVLNRLVWQDSISLFSKKEQQQTINRLLNLGIYKFANIRFENKIIRDTHYLDRYVYLTPGLMRDKAMEFQVNSRSGNFLGTEVSASYSHKNAFKGAELFNISLSTGIETNIGANAGSIINTLNGSLNSSFQLPGIYAPFLDRKRVRGEVLPRTAFSLSDDFQQREGFFTINSFNFSAGYNWRKTKWSHEVDPVFINFINLLKTSNELDDLLNENRRLRTSFENVLVFGTGYKFSYSNQTTAVRGRYFFYRGGVEAAGNLLELLVGKGSTDQPGELLGIPFSQYFKWDNDFRQYFPLRKGMMAGRLNFGVAYPYGNADVIPYIKQYFIGGASSVRAYRIRTLGPGSYVTKVVDDGSNFVDQTGDIKLEMNLEYRFDIFSYLKGALFMDAGNVWLIEGDADESTPEPDGLFYFDSFYKEIAVGTGFGLRIDFDVAVIRFDWAFPVRQPVETNGSHWTFSEIDFLKRSWRRDNIVWNVAIGYPF